MIKKLLLGFLLLSTLATASYADTANIRMRINGATSDNRYFLCIPNVGCLSIARGDAGKVYPFYNDVRMRNLFLTNLQNFEVSAMGLPPSCNVTVKTGETLAIHGTIRTANRTAYIANLYCTRE